MGIQSNASSAKLCAWGNETPCFISAKRPEDHRQVIAAQKTALCFPRQVQAQPQTMTLSQAPAGQQQVQVIPAATTTAQVVQQKLIQQQMVTTASPQIQAPGVQSAAPATTDGQSQQAKVQMRAPVRLKAPNKPS